MEELDRIWTSRLFERGRSYNRLLAATLQPCSHAEFNAHPDFDDVFDLWTQRDNFRGLDLSRLWSFVLNLKHTLKSCSGALAEIGVYQGQSSAVLSHYAHKFRRRVYLADTFEGFPTAHFEDNMGEGKEEAFRDTSLDLARSVVGDYAEIRWVVGSFPDSATHEMKGETYSFVSLDCDVYEPIIGGLRFFWPRMEAGGMIFVHDYSSGHWPGATRAVDEFCAEIGARGVLLPDLSGSYVLVRQANARMT
jgi:Macrocin-O-methyltransferase (TylF)